MKRVLVTGANGQLGMSLRRSSHDLHTPRFNFTDVEDLDITREENIRECIREFKPGCIINCAAYTAVDKAEDDEQAAMKLNGDAVGNLARAAKENDIALIHISTDYVFSGESFRPISEDEPPDPRSAYARSKLAGEENILEVAPRAVIIRTSWLYSEFGRNFAKTILNYAREKKELNVIFDQTGTPTYAGDLAEAILRILPELHSVGKPMILNYSNEGTASWYDFAYAIVSLAGLDCKIKPIRTEEYPLPAKRPFFSVLDKTRFRAMYDVRIPHWYESLEKWYSNLENDRNENR